MEPSAISQARHYLLQATTAATPEAQLRHTLAAAAVLLRQGAPLDERGLAALAASAPAGWLDRKESVQLARLAGVGERAAAGSDVDPLDAEQALRLVGGLVDRVAAGELVQARVLAAPPQPVIITTLPAIPPPLLATPLPLSPAVRPTAPVRPVSGPGWVVWRLLAAGLMTALAVLLLTLGQLILPLVGPPWTRWFVWLLAGGAVALAVRSLLGVARSHPWLAGAAAVLIGLGVGAGWASAADRGWLPPITYVLGWAPTTPTAATPGTGGATLHVGGRALVVQTLGNGLRVRVQPTVGAAELVRLPDGTTVVLLQGPRSADGFTWWQVRGGTSVGWVADEWLAPID